VNRNVQRTCLLESEQFCEMYTGGVPPKMPARTQPTVPNQPSSGGHGGLPMPGMGMAAVLNPMGGHQASSVYVNLPASHCLLCA
jgi:hypothetical protein